MEWLDTAFIPSDSWTNLACTGSTMLQQPIQTTAFPQSQDLVVSPSMADLGSEYRHKWSTSEDAFLIQLVSTQGTNWNFIVNYFPGKTPSCLRRRWVNRLDPRIKKTRWTKEEDELVVKMFLEHGGNWKLMSQSLEGRPPTVIKNHFYGSLKRKLAPQLLTENKGFTKLAEDSLVSSFFACSEDCDEGFDLLTLKGPYDEGQDLSPQGREARLKQLYRRMTSVELILKRAQQQIRRLDEQINSKLER
jgi:hypothetical protein